MASIASRPLRDRKFIFVLCLCLLIAAPLALLSLGPTHIGNHKLQQDKDEQATAIIGINLGSSYSRAAVVKDSKAFMIPNKQGFFQTTSEITIEKFNSDAVKRTSAEKKGLWATFSDMMNGFDWSWPGWSLRGDDQSKPVMMSDRPCHFKADHVDDDDCMTISPKHKTAILLGKMKDMAEAHLQERVAGAVVAGKQISPRKSWEFSTDYGSADLLQ